MNLLRIITPEEIGEIATKHNGGKFLSLTDLVEERSEMDVHRDFSRPESLDEIHDDFQKRKEQEAKILPFKKINTDEEIGFDSLTSQINKEFDKENIESIEHKEDENMSSFILIEKERLKRSQKILKQKEVVDLYQKNIRVDVEQIKTENESAKLESSKSGILVNKRHY